MAESEGDIGYGITVLIEAAPGSGQSDNTTGWIELKECFDLTPPDPSTDDVEVTHYKSPNRTKEFRPGLTDNGTATVSMNYIEGSPTDLAILAWRALAETRKMRVIYLSGVQQTFSAYPKSYKRALPNEDKKTADLEVKVAGSELQEAA